MNAEKRKIELLLCKCSSREHQLIVDYDFDPNDPCVYVSIHLTPLKFWDRLKYLFGYKCRYGAFEEVVLDYNDADKLQDVVNYLNEIKNAVESKKNI